MLSIAVKANGGSYVGLSFHYKMKIISEYPTYITKTMMMKNKLFTKKAIVQFGRLEPNQIFVVK